MRVSIIIFFFTYITFQTYAQNGGNALNFNGSNGYCSASLPTVFDNIASNDFTVECWVKTASSTTTSRVFFAQKDMNNFCTILISITRIPYFYLVRNGTTYSMNTNITLSSTEWNHLAFSWDASLNTIVCYINGNEITGPSGGVSSTGTDGIMTIGARTDGQQINTGSIDELRIWNDVRTPCEILAGMNSQFTVAQPNLVASYNFNQGLAGGSNAGVTSLTELNNNYNATLNGFTLSGSSSNWVTSGVSILKTNNNSEVYYTYDVISSCDTYTWLDGNTYTTSNNTATRMLTTSSGCDNVVTLNLTIKNSTTGTDVQTACDTYTWIDGNTYSSDNTTATYTLTNSADCDSVVTLNLTINSTPINTVSVSGNMLNADETAANYKWLDCDNANAAISDETSQTFNPAVNGNYAVEITKNGCVNTSSCISVVLLDINEYKANNAIQIFPNPSTGMVTLSSVQLGCNYTLRNNLGKVVLQGTIQDTQTHLDLSNMPNGIFFLTIEDNILKLVKQ